MLILINFFSWRDDDVCWTWSLKSVCSVVQTIPFRTQSTNSIVVDVPSELTCADLMMFRTAFLITEQYWSHLQLHTVWNTSLLASVLSQDFQHVRHNKENTWWIGDVLFRNADTGVSYSWLENGIITPIIRRDRHRHQKDCFHIDWAWSSHRTVLVDWTVAHMYCQEPLFQIWRPDVRQRHRDNIDQVIHHSISYNQIQWRWEIIWSLFVRWYALCKHLWSSSMHLFWSTWREIEQFAGISLMW